jgi:peptidyl-prolyl cis-trans isomerase C
MHVSKRNIGRGFALLLCASLGPAGAAAAAPQAAAAAPAAATAPAPTGAPLPPDLVVWQGDAKLTLNDIDGRMSRIPPDKRAGFINDPERIEQMLRGLLLTKLLAHEAEKAGLTQDPVVAAEIELAKDEILARRQLSLHMGSLAVPDFAALAKERYLTSPTLYSSKPTIDVRHLLIDSKKLGDEKAKALAAQLHADVSTGKLDFEQVVREHSDESGAEEDGGLISGLSQGETLADFDAAAFALKKEGELSPVVSTKYGYHILRLEKRVEPKRYPFEQVKAQIEAELKQEFLNRASQEYLDKRRSTTLDANPELVQSLRTRYLPGAPGTLAIGRTQGEIPATDGAPAAGGASAPVPNP